MSQRDGNGKTFGPAGLKRRAELMETAVRLAARQGFSRTRVSDIVGRVGVGQGVFYWYFESKDALFREILEDTTRRLRLFQGAFIAGETDPVRRIAKGILATLDFVTHNGHVFALLDHATTQARLRRERTGATSVHVVDVVRHLSDAMDAGLVRRTEPMFLARSITGVVDRLAREFFAKSERDVDRVAQEAIDFCLGGIVAPRTLDVAELRREVAPSAELLELRDHVGAGGVPEHPVADDVPAR